MHPISHIPIQFIKWRFCRVDIYKIKLLSDGIVDPFFISKNTGIYTLIFISLYSKYT